MSLEDEDESDFTFEVARTSPRPKRTYTGRLMKVFAPTGMAL